MWEESRCISVRCEDDVLRTDSAARRDQCVRLAVVRSLDLLDWGFRLEIDLAFLY